MSGEVTKSAQQTLLPTGAAERKAIPVGTGVLDYFSAALIEVAKVSKMGNDQHNPGQPLHWARGKSEDHYDTMTRHGMERGTTDTDGALHSAKMAWRALAILQLECEAKGAPMSRGSRPAVEPVHVKSVEEFAAESKGNRELMRKLYEPVHELK